MIQEQSPQLYAMNEYFSQFCCIIQVIASNVADFWTFILKSMMEIRSFEIDLFQLELFNTALQTECLAKLGSIKSLNLFVQNSKISPEIQSSLDVARIDYNPTDLFPDLTAIHFNKKSYWDGEIMVDQFRLSGEIDLNNTFGLKRPLYSIFTSELRFNLNTLYFTRLDTKGDYNE